MAEQEFSPWGSIKTSREQYKAAWKKARLGELGHFIADADSLGMHVPHTIIRAQLSFLNREAEELRAAKEFEIGYEIRQEFPDMPVFEITCSVKRILSGQ